MRFLIFFNLSSMLHWLSACDCSVVPCLADDAVHAASSCRNPPQTFDHDSRGASSRCRQVWPWSFFFPSGPAAPVCLFLFFPPGSSVPKWNFGAASLNESKLWRRQQTTHTQAATCETQPWLWILISWPGTFSGCLCNSDWALGKTASHMYSFVRLSLSFPLPISAALTCQLYSIILCLVHSRLSDMTLALIHSTFSAAFPYKKKIEYFFSTLVFFLVGNVSIFKITW